MSHYMQKYHKTILSVYEQVMQEEQAIGKAAALMTSAILDDKLIHVFGPGGHSNMGAYEMFWRAGGLVPINAILDPGTAVQYGAKRSNHIERLHGYTKAVFDAYRISDGVIIIVNAYGINSMTIDAALEAKKRSVPSIGIGSTTFGKNVPEGHPARHPSNKNLYELVDVFVDCHMPYGDAVVDFEGVEQKVGPTSTLANCFTINLVVVETVRQLVEKGYDPPLWMSANIPGGDESNRKYEEKYGFRIKHLL